MSAAPALPDESETMEPKELLRLLEINAYGVYLNTLVGNPAPRVAALFERITHPQVGDLVLEITTLHHETSDGDRLGRYLRKVNEPIYSSDDYGITAEDLLLTHEVIYIQTFDGRECRWHNADFIVVAESVDLFR